MSNATDALKNAWRDFNSDRVPASGALQPDKAQIRSALDKLDGELSSIGAGIARYATKTVMDAVTSAADGQLAYVFADSTEANNAVYQWDDGEAEWVEAAWYFNAVAGVVQPLVDDAEAARDTAADLVAPFTVIEQTMRATSVALYSGLVNDTTSWAVAAGFGGVAFVVDGSDLVDDNPDKVLGALRTYLQAGAGAVRIEAKLYRRIVAQASALPGAAASDTVLLDRDIALADLDLSAGGAMKEVEFSFAPIIVDAAYSYVFSFEAFDASDDLVVIGFGRGPLADGAPARYAGFFRSTLVASWAAVTGAAAPATWLYPTYYDVQAIGEDVAAAERQLTKVDLSFPTEFRAAGARESDGSSYAASDNHYRWAFGVQVGDDVPAGSTVSHIGVSVELSPTITKIMLRIWRRPTDDATESDFPGTGPDDEAIFVEIQPLADIDLEAVSGDFQSCVFPFTPFITAAGQTYIFEFVFYNDANVTQGAGITRDGVVTGLSPQQRGFFDASGVLGGTAALAWQLGSEIYTATSATVSSGTDTRDRIESATASSTGLALDVAGVFLRGSSRISFTGELTATTPTNGNVTDEVITLTSPTITTPHKYFNPLGALAHTNVSTVVVKDAGTNAVLVAGTDYLIEPTMGVLSRASAGANRSVKVTYHWSKYRYDLVCIHAETLALSLVAGTERDTDAGEFVPSISSSALIPLFHARVAGGFDAELIPVWYLDGLIHRDLIASRNADYERQRRALEPILAMARRGDTITVAAMGDSILEQGNATSPNSAANGATRDRPDYFLFNIGSDRVDDLPLYNQGDGAGTVHIHQSTAWKFCEALVDLGATVAFRNFGLGGSTSGSGTNNGGDTVLRAAVWATNPHVLISHYGMNESGSDDTEANLVNLFTEAFDEGVLAVLAIGQPRPSSRKPTSLEGVRKTWRATRRAAEFFRNGAYFAPERLVDTDWLGAMGISFLDYGSSDGFHHPGIRECDVYGAEMHALVCGE